MNHALSACFSVAFALPDFWRKLGRNDAVFIEATKCVFIFSAAASKSRYLGETTINLKVILSADAKFLT